MAKVRQHKKWTHDKFLDDFGQVIWVHKRTVCAGEFCAIHNPSDHRMKDWRMLMRASTLIERNCCHGVGHPDPDSVAWFDSIGRTWMGVHGCDRCCFTPEGIAKLDGEQICQPQHSIPETVKTDLSVSFLSPGI
jgi:hypothetical protein